MEGEGDVGELVEVEDGAVAMEGDEVAEAVGGLEAVFAGEAAESEQVRRWRFLHGIPPETLFTILWEGFFG